MDTIAKRDKILNDFIEVRQNILELASDCPTDLQDKVFLGTWSMKDLIAHLVGWDYTNMKAAHAVEHGKLPDFYTYIDKDWSSYNALLVIQHKKDNYDQLLTCTQDSHQELVSFLETIPAEDFFKDWGVRYKGYILTIARLIIAETKDERVHLAQMVEFLDHRLTN